MMVTAVAVAGLAVLSTGCSDDAGQGSDAQATTEGLQEEVVEGVRFGYPQGWSGSVPSTEADFAVAGPDGANGAPSELRFSYDERDIDAPFEDRYQITVGSIRDRAFGSEELEERDVEVPGALAARLLVFAYDVSDAAESREFALLVQVDERHVALLRLAGPEDVVTDELAERVIGSVAVER